MKSILIKSAVWVLLFSFAAVLPVESNPELHDNAETGMSELISLHECTDDEMSVSFLCNPNWELETEADVLFIVISHDPAVTLTIARSDDEIFLLDQLTEPILQELGRYGEGFTVERVKVAGQEAIAVSGYSESDPDLRVRDYYMIRDDKLFSILFSISPRGAWNAYQDLFTKMIESVRFLE